MPWTASWGLFPDVTVRASVVGDGVQEVYPVTPFGRGLGTVRNEIPAVPSAATGWRVYSSTLVPGLLPIVRVLVPPSIHSTPEPLCHPTSASDTEEQGLLPPSGMTVLSLPCAPPVTSALSTVIGAFLK